MKILVVDDSAAFAAFLCSQLQEMGFDSAFTCKPLTEQELANSSLVLMDLHFRRVNGFEQGCELPHGLRDKLLLYSFHARTTDSAWAKAIGLTKVLAFPVPSARLEKELALQLSIIDGAEA